MVLARRLLETKKLYHLRLCTRQYKEKFCLWWVSPLVVPLYINLQFFTHTNLGASGATDFFSLNESPPFAFRLLQKLQKTQVYFFSSYF